MSKMFEENIPDVAEDDGITKELWRVFETQQGDSRGNYSARAGFLGQNIKDIRIVELEDAIILRWSCHQELGLGLR